MKRIGFALVALIGFTLFTPVSTADSGITLRQSAEYLIGYNRNLFKLWIDADKNGCDTRKEVLISEAIVKPKKGAKCALTGGTWISPYDGKSFTKNSSLDIDHVVPLAEAWRSGAWAWTPKQREIFANDLSESRALVAVTASVNRSKGDQDIKSWLPALDKCEYLEAWIAVKARYTLTFDQGELAVINSYADTCGLQYISAQVLPAFETVANKLPSSTNSTEDRTQTPTPSPSPTVTAPETIKTTPLPSASQTPSVPPVLPSQSPSPVISSSPIASSLASLGATPTTSSLQTITPGAFCSPAGATGKSSSGVTYTCKTSSTDSRNRWRQ